MKDPYQVKDVQKEETLRIEYSQPKFWHRCMANFVDFFLFALSFLLLFIGTRSIVQNTPAYKATISRMNDIQLSCGLYVKSNSGNTATKNLDIIYYTDRYQQTYGKQHVYQPEWDAPSAIDRKYPVGKNGYCVKAIHNFLSFSNPENGYVSKERYQELIAYYAEATLTPTINGLHYFLKDSDNNIIPNEIVANDANYSEKYYTQIYKPFIEKRCIPFLTANVKEYSKLNKVDYNCLLFIEFPIAFVLGAILTYYVPPLFFKRGRMTLGKALYHIGLIDQRLLSPTIGRFTARFAILFFGELLLSLFSFGIPYIISFSIMAFSKKRQGFPDYMLRLLEIDTSKANIYMDYVEAALKNDLHGKAVDFQMEKPL